MGKLRGGGTERGENRQGEERSLTAYSRKTFPAQDVDECVAFYTSLPQTDPECLAKDTGVSYALQGNTTLCRFLHHFMTKTSPEVHCYHVGKGFRPDVNGHYRCSAHDCQDDSHDEHTEEVRMGARSEPTTS